MSRRTLPCALRRHARACGLAAFVVLALLFLGRARAAHADTFGQRGQLVVDQLSGFRVASDGNINYYGPIGFSTRGYTTRGFDTTQTIDTTLSTTTFWLAPSADFFLIDHLSIGGLVEIAATSSSTTAVTNGVTASNSLPGTTDVTILPRAGWLFNLGDRFAIWPRLGIGFASRQTLTGNAMAMTPGITTDTINGILIDLDVGFLYRFTDGWFLKAAPQLSFLPGGSHSSATNGVSVSADANMFQFAAIAGIGVYLDL